MLKKILIFVAVGLSLCHLSLAWASDIVKIGNDATVEVGTSVKDIVTVFGDLKVDGTVTGDAVVIGGDLKVASTGRVLGDTVVILGSIIKEPGAEISKDSVEIPFGRSWCARSCIIPIIGILGMLGFAMVFGFIILLLLISILWTDKVGVASFYAERHLWKTIYHGFIVTVLLIPVTLFLIISIVGLPLIPLLVIVISAATLFGWTVMCQLVGLKFFHAIKRRGQMMIWEVIVGFIILALITMIPIVGWLIKLFVWFAGLGATLATRFGTRRA